MKVKSEQKNDFNLLYNIDHFNPIHFPAVNNMHHDHDKFNDVGPVHHGCLALCLSCPWSKFNVQDYFNLCGPVN